MQSPVKTEWNSCCVLFTYFKGDISSIHLPGTLLQSSGQCQEPPTSQSREMILRNVKKIYFPSDGWPASTSFEVGKSQSPERKSCPFTENFGANCFSKSVYDFLLWIHRTRGITVLFSFCHKTGLSPEQLPLVVQWLRFCASNAKGMDLIPGWGTKTSLALWHGQKINK